MAAPTFPDPEAIDFDVEDIKSIELTIDHLCRDTIRSRQKWQQAHLDYDLEFRGEINADRVGPWEGSANLHVQLPYWLVDAYNARLMNGIWGQIPLVSSKAEEDADQEVSRDSAHLVSWHLQSKRMDARSNWGRISKTRCIHGLGVGIMPWVRDVSTYRTKEDLPAIQFGPDGVPLLDEEDTAVIASGENVTVNKRTLYEGPMLTPVNWDDVIDPMDGWNLQPVRKSNPGGADFVGIRQWESLSLIWSKIKSSYTYITDDDEMKDRDWWETNAPSQDRNTGSSSTGSENQQETKLQDFIEGRERNQATQRGGPDVARNPQFENLVWFMPWSMEVEDENGKKQFEDVECIFFYCLSLKKLLGAFRLSDVDWQEKRPLIELHFQTVNTRRHSLGIMEITRHLSAELDTIHNMRMDIGFISNIPFFFYSSTTNLNPEEIKLSPGKGIPVDNPREIVFPQMQNVTSFYYQEEQLIYSLAERVLGVTDLFLGVSPTKGAAARHATGFVGTQQEAMARTSEVMAGDAREFGSMCHMIHSQEVQYGPPYRILRLQGKEGPLQQRLDRDQLWFRGEYDFSLGANQGMFSHQIKQQQADTLLSFAASSPLVNQDPGRIWEVSNFALHSYGFDNPSLYIGPKEAVSSGTPRSADEESSDMDQFVYGVGVPAPVTPSDNDTSHIQSHMEHVSSEAYMTMGRPNLKAHSNHIMMHHEQMEQRTLMQENQAQVAITGAAGGEEGGGEQPLAQNVAQLEGVGSMGAMGDVSQRPGGNGSLPPAPPQY